MGTILCLPAGPHDPNEHFIKIRPCSPEESAVFFEALGYQTPEDQEPKPSLLEE